MTATPVSRPKADSARALELLAEARELLEPFDARGTLIDVARDVWDQPARRSWQSFTEDVDARWSIAALILDHDSELNEPLMRRALSDGAQVIEQLDELNSSLGQTPDKDWVEEARELRDAMERLSEAVSAVSAVYLLPGYLPGEVKS